MISVSSRDWATMCEAVTQLQRESQSLSKQVGTLVAELARVKNELSERTKEIDELRQGLIAEGGRLKTELREKASERAKEYDGLKRHTENLETRVSVLEAQPKQQHYAQPWVEELQKEIAEVRMRVQAVERQWPEFISPRLVNLERNGQELAKRVSDLPPVPLSCGERADSPHGYTPQPHFSQCCPTCKAALKDFVKELTVVKDDIKRLKQDGTSQHRDYLTLLGVQKEAIRGTINRVVADVNRELDAMAEWSSDVKARIVKLEERCKPDAFSRSNGEAKYAGVTRELEIVKLPNQFVDEYRLPYLNGTYIALRVSAKCSDYILDVLSNGLDAMRESEMI